LLASYAYYRQEAALGDFSVFEYCYRDASNYKSWGCLLLKGRLTSADFKILQERLESGEFFIAEQLGIPPLYAELWALSGGPTSDDHVWHSFHALRPAETDEMNTAVFDTVENFIARLAAITQWDGKLSPHWDG
jgi:hypothetical protein